jgi:hypothetical protein
MMKQLKKLRVALGIVVFGGMLASSPMYALSCGEQVSGVVNLTADLNCNNSHGLVVAASNTTINLNGFTISCAGSGFENTCQRLDSKPASVGYEGIRSIGFNDVTVNGPGGITGFTVGVYLISGQFLNVHDVTVEGPYTPPFAQNTRGDTTGILVGLITCPSVRMYNAPGVSFTLTNNWVVDQGIGISIQFAACGTVSGNTVMRNAKGAEASGWGIEVLQSNDITLSKNNVSYNGTGVAMGGGLHIANGSTGIQVISNSVSANCGEGVYADNVSGNGIHKNTALSNGVYWGFSQCVFIAPGTYFDFAESGATNNSWTYDNHCHTQTQGNIPFGVCNP